VELRRVYAPNGQNNSYFFEMVDGFADLNPADPDGSGRQPRPSRRSRRSRAEEGRRHHVHHHAGEPFSEFKAVLRLQRVSTRCRRPRSPRAGVVRRSYEDAPIGDGPFKMKGTWQHRLEDRGRERGTRTRARSRRSPGSSSRSTRTSTPPTPTCRRQPRRAEDDPDVADLANAAGDLGDRYQHSPSSTFQFLAFPTYDPAVRQGDVRRAISDGDQP
jgi:peptide/nickel transport system substrate-binding protein/oligopeptide transport system substrate-binding protein